MVEWITKSVTHDGDKADNLVHQNPDFEGFYNALRTLSQIRIGGKCRIYLHIQWGRRPDGRYRATAVDFSTNSSPQESRIVANRLERTRQLDLANSRETNSRTDVRQMVFPAEDHSAKALDFYVHMGTMKLEEAFKLVHNSAKKDAALPENPFESPLQSSTGATNYVLDKVPGGDVVTTAEAVATGDFFSLGVKGVESFAGKYVEEAGVPFMEFFELTLGGMCDAAISGQAGRVSKIRSHGYVYFTYGFLLEMVCADVPDPRSDAEVKYFVGGENVVRRLINSPLQQFYVQTALLHYASQHATGTWDFSIDPEEWIFPDNYIRKWSPQLLARSMLTQLCKQKYLVD